MNKIKDKNYQVSIIIPCRKENKFAIKAVEYLINHPKEAQKTGENGKKAVAEKYNWENESKKLLSLYKNSCVE